MHSTVVNRIVAKFIDLILVMLVAALLPRVVGPILGFAYSLLADGMPFKGFEGRSVGKKLLGFRVLSIKRHGAPADFKDSLIRNSPVGFATFFSIIPVWGWIILPVVGIPLMAIEVYLMMKADRGQRIGDVMADTEVISVKKP